MKISLYSERARLGFPKAATDPTMSPERPEAHPEVLKREK